MKRNQWLRSSSMNWLRSICAAILVWATVDVNAQTTGDNKIAPPVTYADIIGTVHSGDLEAFNKITGKFHGERNEFIQKLLSVVQDKKSSNYEQCAAAYYLGEMGASDSVNVLASNIILTLDRPIFNLTVLMQPPAVEALIKIGNPSIPALIRNLQESDDPKVRGLSLKVLYRIEGDKDIVQLRLQ